MSSTATESRSALNITALRATQASIMNLDRKFDMGSWDRCVHGHAHMVLPGQATPVICGMTGLSSACPVPSFLGLTADETATLFTRPRTREDACQAIDRLIENHLIDTPAWAPEPVAEPMRELVAV